MEAVSIASPSATKRTLYQHTQRDQWGHGMLAWRGKDRACLMFEDGKARVIASRFFFFLRPTKPENGDRIRVHLGQLIEAEGIEPRGMNAPKRAPKQPRRSVTEQLEIFKHLYPEGFTDPKFQRQVRGADAKRRLKRHLDAAVKDAEKQLNYTRTARRLESGEADGVFSDMLKVLSKTALISPKQMKAFEHADEFCRRSIAEAFGALMAGEEYDIAAYRTWIEKLRRAGISDWKSVSVLPAIAAPKRYVYVDPTAMRKQMKSMGMSKSFGRTPTTSSYHRASTLMTGLGEELAALGFEPGDLLDVAYFIQQTHRPSVLKSFKEAQENAPVEQASEVASDEAQQEAA